jgi:predicted dinucleotide-utilizing enzyme
MLGIGLIGLGQHGSRYARHIVDDLPDAALVAVCQRSRTEGTKLAATYGCAFHDDCRDLVANPSVEAVVVAVPPMLHPAIVDATCRAGSEQWSPIPSALTARCKHSRRTCPRSHLCIPPGRGGRVDEVSTTRGRSVSLRHLPRRSLTLTRIERGIIEYSPTERDGYRMGAHAVARDAAGGVGGR